MLKTFLLFLLASTFEVFASYDEGRIAFDRGEYTVAYELWLQAAKNIKDTSNNSLQWATPSPDQQKNAQYAIAVLFWQGKGVEQSYQQAAKWLHLAISSGHIEAQLKLGFLYLQGKGVEKDEVKARKYFLITADYGFVDAQFNLGVMYLKGVGGVRNISKAKYWLKKAALQGDAQAFEELMRLPEYGAQLLAKKTGPQSLDNSNKHIQQTKTQLTDKKTTVTPTRLALPIKKQAIKLHEPEWLLKQSNKFAIQVMAVRSMGQLQDFTKGLSVDGDWGYYTKQKGIHKYFVLLRCCFSDKKTIHKIRQSFPAKIKKLQPFLVNLKQVKPLVISNH